MAALQPQLQAFSIQTQATLNTQVRLLEAVRTRLSLATLVLFHFTSPVIASNCFNNTLDERLKFGCALREAQTNIISYSESLELDNVLKRNGYPYGLAINLDIPYLTSIRDGELSPIFFYSENINGGNSPAPLVLGALTFVGDKALVRKQGVLAGLRARFSGRYIYGEGRYLNYGINASYAHSPDYDIGITSTGASVCSINHIAKGWYVDACTNTSRARKAITDETNSNLSLAGSKIFTTGVQSYSMASLGMNRFFSDTYTQNQLVFSFNTIYKTGAYSALNLTVGESVENQLATKFAVNGQLTTQLAHKPLKLSTSYSQAGGGMLLGVGRDETTIAVSVSYPIWKNLTASVGYRHTASSIDYFDVSTPTFGVEFAAIQF